MKETFIATGRDARLGRLVELDALRAAAVLLVIWVHTTDTSVGVGAFALAGYHGVLLFFVISGFLITGILLDARSAAWPGGTPARRILMAFYARRFLRIFPLYYLVLIGAALALPPVRHSIEWHVAYLSNWYFAWRNTFDDWTAHFWSLAVEEQFYLVWPWFVLLLSRSSLVWTMLSMTLIGPLTRLAICAAGVSGPSGWVTTPSVLDPLGLGCLLAYAWHATDERASRRLANWAGIVGLGLMTAAQGLTWVRASSAVVFTIQPLGWSLVCVWMVHHAARSVRGPLGRGLRAGPVIYVGSISYGIYLIHPFVPAMMSAGARTLGTSVPAWLKHGYGAFVIVSLTSVLFAALSWRFFEGPLNDLKRRFPYVHRDQAAPERTDPCGAPCAACGHAPVANERACSRCGATLPPMLTAGI